MTDDDPRVALGQMNAAWSDIRSYTGQIWQVAAVTITVLVLTVSIYVASMSPDTDIPIYLQIAVLLLSLAFISIGSYTIHWLRSSVSERVDFILEIEEKLAIVKGGSYVTPTSRLFGIEKGPLRAIYILFLILTIVMSIIAGSAILNYLSSITIDIVIQIMYLCGFLVVFFVYGMIFYRFGIMRKMRVSYENRHTLLSLLRAIVEDDFDYDFKRRYGFTQLMYIFRNRWQFEVELDSEERKVLIAMVNDTQEKEKIQDVKDSMKHYIDLTDKYEKKPAYAIIIVIRSELKLPDESEIVKTISFTGNHDHFRAEFTHILSRVQNIVISQPLNTNQNE